MNVKETIQYYIDMYGGSEKRVIDNVIREHKCNETVVEKNISWLIKKDYIDVITQRDDMNDEQKRYCDSDFCRILSNVKRYNEIEYDEEMCKRKEEIDKLPNEKKFIELFKEMEKDFNHSFNEKNYTYEITKDSAIIRDIDGNVIADIDLVNTSNWSYYEADNRILYKKDNNYHAIELYYMHGKCNVKHYKS